MTSQTHTVSPHVRVVPSFGCQAGLPTDLFPVSVNIEPPHLLISANCGVLENVIQPHLRQLPTKRAHQASYIHAIDPCVARYSRHYHSLMLLHQPGGSTKNSSFFTKHFNHTVVVFFSGKNTIKHINRHFRGTYKVSVDVLKCLLMCFIVLLPLKKTTAVWLKRLVKKDKFFVEPPGQYKSISE